MHNKINHISNNKIIAPILLAVLALIWGTSFMLIKKGLVVFSYHEVALLRVVSAFFFLLPFSLSRLVKLSWINHVRLFVSGLMGILIPSFLFSIAQTQLDSLVVGIINSLTPIWAIVIGATMWSQQFTKYTVLGVIMGFGGAVLLIMSTKTGNLSSINIYVLLLVIATSLYGFNLNFVKYKLHHIDALTMTSVSTFVIGCVSTLFLFGCTDFTVKLITYEGAWKAFSLVVLLGLMSTAVAVILLNHVIKLKSPLYAGSVTYFIPFVATILGLFDGEHLNKYIYAGVIAIVGGVHLINKK